MKGNNFVALTGNTHAKGENTYFNKLDKVSSAIVLES